MAREAAKDAALQNLLSYGGQGAKSVPEAWEKIQGMLDQGHPVMKQLYDNYLNVAGGAGAAMKHTLDYFRNPSTGKTSANWIPKGSAEVGPMVGMGSVLGAGALGAAAIGRAASGLKHDQDAQFKSENDLSDYRQLAAGQAGYVAPPGQMKGNWRYDRLKNVALGNGAVPKGSPPPTY